MKKGILLGVGINDADYPVKPTVNGRVVTCPFYMTWHSMIYRAYSTKLHARNPTYADASVSYNWHSFMNFRSWMVQQDWEGKCLDKDLLVPGNKCYSEDTCIFITKEVNMFLVESSSRTRGEWPLGVYWNKREQVFFAQCGNRKKGGGYIGMFSTPEEAHNAYLNRKWELAQILADKQDDIRVRDAILKRYEVKSETSKRSALAQLNKLLETVNVEILK